MVALQLNLQTTQKKTPSPDALAAAEQIFQKFEQLDAARRYLFVEWLIAHCRFAHGENIYHGLTNWLSEMTAEDAKIQQDIILLEADWWANQTDATVRRLITEHLSDKKRRRT
ncbi:MAG: hypothetical protein HRF47_10065 [Chloroflexota bacterium]|jgi:hypothetical protein